MSKLPLTAGGAIDAVDNATVAVIRGGLPFDSAGKLVVTTSNAEADRQNGYSLDSARRIRVATSGTVARIQHGLAFDSQGRLIVTDVDPGQGIMRVGRRYSSAGSMFMAGLAFTPAALSGLSAWYDASKATGITDGAEFNTWVDSSGNGRNANGSAGTSPLYRTAQINGLPVARFDGVNDFLQAGAFTQGPEWTVFAVADSTKVTFPQNIVDADAGGAPNRFAQYLRYGGAAAIEAIGFQADGASAASDSQSATATDWNVLTGRRDASTVEAFVNGASNGSAALGNAGTLSSVLRLGARVAGDNFLGGDLAEVILYNRALTTAERQQVEGYLLDKYALRPPQTGLQGWYDASTLALADGAAVASWPDSSGNGRTATQGNAALRPTYRASGIGGKPDVEFYAAGTSTSLALPAQNWPGDWTVVGVYKVETTPSSVGQILHSETPAQLMQARTQLTSPQTIAYTGASASVDGGPSFTSQANVIATWQARAEATETWTYGVSNGTSAVSGTLRANAAATLQLGASSINGTNEPLDGRIAEVLLYTRVLTTAERQQAERYLGAKYGITVA